MLGLREKNFKLYAKFQIFWDDQGWDFNETKFNFINFNWNLKFQGVFTKFLSYSNNII
jgi:hypothetical protein